MNQVLTKLAAKFKVRRSPHYCLLPETCSLTSPAFDTLLSQHVKFVKIIAQDAIPNFPDRSAPTLLIYRNVRSIL